MSKIIIISTGWRCTEFVNRCVESVSSQNVKSEVVHNWIIDDDNQRKGKVFNFLRALSETNPTDDDLIFDLDLDDQLEAGSIETVRETYAMSPELLLTYGSYRTESGRPARFNGEYFEENFRYTKWVASHLKTFKYGLFKKIKHRDLMGADGKHYMTCSDLAFMFPMMEMAGLDRIQNIKKVLYIYNDLSPYNDHKAWGDEQRRTDRWIRKQPKYRRI